MAKFRQGGAPKVVIETIDPLNPQNGPIDVGSVTITIWDDEHGDIIVNAAAMTRLSQGTYLYQFQLSGTARIGQWWRQFTITDENGFVNPEEPEPAFEVTA
jgi:hypothetical protein